MSAIISALIEFQVQLLNEQVEWVEGRPGLEL